MIWVFLIVVVIMIPEVVSILVESRLARALANRIEGGERADDTAALEDRIHWLEGEVERLGRTLEEVRAQGEFVQRLLEDGGGLKEGDGDETPRRPRDPDA
jgi:hypothetical protein